MISETEDSNTISYSYDLFDRLYEITDGTTAGGMALKQVYNYMPYENVLQSYQLTNGSSNAIMTLYEYNTAGQLYKVYDNNILHATYTYDENGNNISILYANGMLTELTYTPGNMVESLTVKQENSYSFDYKELYEYNLQGNLVEKTVYDNPQWDPLYHLYTYDTAGMLTSESYGIPYFEYWKNDYSYDNRGNRTSLVKTIYGSDFEKGVTYTYDLNNRLISSATDNAYDDDFTTAYTYDANANMLTEIRTEYGTVKCVKTYTYDKANRLISETNSEENIRIEYSYDSAGNMSSKITKNLQNIDEIISTFAYNYNSRNENICNMYNENGSVITDEQSSYDYDGFERVSVFSIIWQFSFYKASTRRKRYEKNNIYIIFNCYYAVGYRH